MVSSSPYCSPHGASELYRRSEQSISLPRTLRHHESLSDIGEDLHRRLSTPSDNDGKVGSGQARRRIAVACQRCRKRKIKCSGDPGNGQGCSNCRSAGTAPANCTFLRVKSSECEAFLSSRGPIGGNRYSPYPTSQPVPARTPALQIHTNNEASGHLYHISGQHDGYHSLYGVGRSNYPPYSPNYDDESNCPNSPALILPGCNDNTIGTAMLGGPNSPKPWEVYPSPARISSGIYSGQSPQNSAPITGGSYAGNGLAYTSQLNENSPALQGGSAFGPCITNADRTLPNPTISRAQNIMSVPMGNHLMESLAIGGISYRSQPSWSGSDDMSGSSQSSHRPGSISYSSSVDNNTASDPQSATGHESIGYPSIAQNSPASTVGSSVIQGESSKPETQPQACDLINEERARMLSHDHRSGSESETGEGYDYSSDLMVGGRKTRNGRSTRVVTNGRRYFAVQQPPPMPTVPMFNNPEPEITNHHHQTMRPTSMTPLSSSATY